MRFFFHRKILRNSLSFAVPQENDSFPLGIPHSFTIACAFPLMEFLMVHDDVGLWFLVRYFHITVKMWCTQLHNQATLQLLLNFYHSPENEWNLLCNPSEIFKFNPAKRVVRIEQLPICPPTRHFPIYVSTFWPSVRESWSVSKKLCRVLCRQAAFCVFYGLLLGLTSCVRTADACCLGCWFENK